MFGGAALDLYGLFRKDRKGVEDSAVMLTAIHAVAGADPIGPSARCQAALLHRQPPAYWVSFIQATKVTHPLANCREIVRFRSVAGVLCSNEV